MRGVDERCINRRRYSESNAGGDTSENAGMSSENYVRIIMVENLRFPEEGSSSQGMSGPKPRTIVVGDGQSVNIPIPPSNRMQ